MQNKILTLLSLAQMWKFFSHFGVRALLVLYMVKYLHYSDTHAFGVNAVFCGLVELGGIFGGIIADRYLGLKKATLIGGWLLAAGYAVLLLEQGLFWGLGLIIAGGSLFSSNIMALLGLAYTENDPQRKKGFTIFYMMQNLGALISTIICGFIAIHYGFRLSFAIAASGMVIGNLILFFNQGVLQHLGQAPKKGHRMGLATILCTLLFAIGALCVWSEKIVFLFLPWATGGVLLYFAIQLVKNTRWPKEEVYKLFVYLGALILFFAVEDQICSSLVLFAERQTERSLFGWTIPSSFITSVNPIVILLLGSVIAKRHVQMMTPFALTAGAFGILSIFCLMALPFSIFGVMGVVTVISIAELMIGPLVTSYTSELAAKDNPGMVMGMVPIAFSLAFSLSGGVGKMVAIEKHQFSLPIYGTGFGVVALLVLGGGFILQLLMKRFSSEKNPVR